jgi:predicted patatin/cPLA2 family phospholipase
MDYDIWNNSLSKLVSEACSCEHVSEDEGEDEFLKFAKQYASDPRYRSLAEFVRRDGNIEIKTAYDVNLINRLVFDVVSLSKNLQKAGQEIPRILNDFFVWLHSKQNEVRKQFNLATLESRKSRRPCKESRRWSS